MLKEDRQKIFQMSDIREQGALHHDDEESVILWEGEANVAECF